MAHFYMESFSLEDNFFYYYFCYSDTRVGKIPSVFIKKKKYCIF